MEGVSRSLPAGELGGLETEWCTGVVGGNA